MQSKRSKFRIWLAIYGVIFLLTACATHTTVTVTDNNYSPISKSCSIQFFSQTKPTSDYATIAKIESHVQKNMFFGKTATLEDDAYAELRKKACAVGGDAVVIDDYVESTASEFSHVHVWATVIRLK